MSEKVLNIKKAVGFALENATDNGCSFEDWTFKAIAEDLMDYDADLEKESTEVVLPHVIDWFNNADLLYRPKAN